MSTTMKAWAIRKAGGPEVLEHLEVPKPTLTLPKDLLVKVKAVALNPVDYKVRKNHSGADGVARAFQIAS